MGLRHTTPLKFSPVSVCDCLDSTDIGPGAMSSLRNLIPDPTTKNLWQPRPASILSFDLNASGFNSGFSSGFSSGFGGPASAGSTFVSVFKVLGTRVYGLVGSSLFTTTDIPFCFDTATGLFVNITGMTLANTPVSQPATGAWVPPTCDLIGTKLVFTHPGFTGAGGVYFGYIDVSDPSALTWTGGNTTGAVTFTTAPTSVKQFGGRAYYTVNPPTGQPSIVLSDVLAATVVTNAGQVLTFGDNLPLTALGALALNNQLGGIIQALIVFKATTNMYQITGDYALGTLTVNALNVATGTLAPNSVCSTSKGLAFVSPEGLRIIDYNAQVSDPIGDAGSGVTVPFIQAVVPSRIAAAFNADTLRISVQDGSDPGTPNEEYWFDFSRQVWSGGHDFAASLIAPFGATFIKTAIGVNAKMFQSDAVVSPTSTFVENGTQMTWDWKTSMLPDTDQMSENAMIETTINMALAPNIPVNVSAVDQDGRVFDTVTVETTGSSTLWGAFTWGQAVWQGVVSALASRAIHWHIPIVFQRLAIWASGQSASGVKVGRMHLKYEQLGYLQQ